MAQRAKSQSKSTSASERSVTGAVPPKKAIRRARETAREADRLIKKKGSKVAESAVQETLAALATVTELLPDKKRDPVDATALWSATEELEALLAKHFGRWRKSVAREYIESIAWAIVLALIIRFFLFEAFSIPSGSMLPTLEIGDHLFVNKIGYGLYVPLSPHRFVHWDEPSRGDIVVFEFHQKGNKHDGEDYIKRVIGVPGDRVSLRDNVLYINGEPVPTEVVDPATDPDFDGKCPVHMSDNSDRPDGYCPCVRQRERLGDGKDPSEWDHEYISQHFVSGPDGSSSMYCSNKADWTAREYPGSELPDHFRPPACRMDSVAHLGAFGRRFREACLANAPEGDELVVPEGHVFAMGDNRDQSEDGRYWGLVPFDKIKGSAFVIWYPLSRMFTWLE